jgi:hypothetical protein
MSEGLKHMFDFIDDYIGFEEDVVESEITSLV